MDTEKNAAEIPMDDRNRAARPDAAPSDGRNYEDELMDLLDFDDPEKALRMADLLAALAPPPPPPARKTPELTPEERAALRERTWQSFQTALLAQQKRRLQETNMIDIGPRLRRSSGQQSIAWAASSSECSTRESDEEQLFVAFHLDAGPDIFCDSNENLFVRTGTVSEDHLVLSGTSYRLAPSGYLSYLRIEGLKWSDIEDSLED